MPRQSDAQALAACPIRTPSGVFAELWPKTAGEQGMETILALGRHGGSAALYIAL